MADGASGVTPVTARGRVVELSNNQPVKIGDIEVKAGDYAIADGSGVVDVADVFYLINAIFAAGPPPTTLGGDADGDGTVVSQ
jgi:hypothetical protein